MTRSTWITREPPMIWRAFGAIITIVFWCAVTGLSSFLATREFNIAVEKALPIKGELIMAKDATEEDLWNLLELYEIRHADWVFTQMQHETDKFTSNVFLDCNNPFGMKLSKRRNASTWCRRHAYFTSLNIAFKDFKEYQDLYMVPYEARNGAFQTIEDYLDFLERAHYAEDSAYKKNVSNLHYQSK